MDRIKETVSNLTGGGTAADPTGADAVEDAPTDVAGAAARDTGTPDFRDGESPRFGPTEGGIAEILPGGRGVGTDADDTLAEAPNPGPQDGESDTDF